MTQWTINHDELKKGLTFSTEFYDLVNRYQKYEILIKHAVTQFSPPRNDRS